MISNNLIRWVHTLGERLPIKELETLIKKGELARADKLINKILKACEDIIKDKPKKRTQRATISKRTNAKHAIIKHYAGILPIMILAEILSMSRKSVQDYIKTIDSEGSEQHGKQ